MEKRYPVALSERDYHFTDGKALRGHYGSMRETVTLAYSTIGAGSPLVLVHGSGGDGTRWAPLLPVLQARFSVYVVDRRGHGRSLDRPHYRIEDEFADIAALLDFIGNDDITVVAHSYGALCALGAACCGAELSRLVLYEPPLPANRGDYCPPGLIQAMRAALNRDDRDAAMAAFATGVVGLSEREIARRRRLGVWAEMTGNAPIVLRELERVASLNGRASSFSDCRVPTLLLVGGASPPEYHATAALLTEVLPHSRLKLLPGQGHRAIDLAPEMFAAAITEFIDETARLR